MLQIERKTKILEGVSPDAIPYADLLRSDEPAILKGVVKEWPLVQSGKESPGTAMRYLLSFHNGKPVVTYSCEPNIGGRYFYNDELTGLNFKAGRAPLADVLERISSTIGETQAPSHYIGSTDLDIYFPGLRAKNDLVLNDPMFTNNPPIVSAWIGSRTIASAHYDMSNNIACCMVGRRRFTLFPPEQVANLYPGPLEPTPGGQVVSMVDFRNPDFDRYPRFRKALDAAQVADLEPGDILFYPAMWWHHVEALDDFNIMINYWWNTSPAFMDTPQNTMLHALLSLRDRPAHEKRAWKALFDYYVFGDGSVPAAHLPAHAQGNLGPMDEVKARRLRALLLQRLNR